MTQTIFDLGGSTREVLRFPDPQSKNWSAFNPSIGMSPQGEVLMTIRSSNYLLNRSTGNLQLLQGSDITSRMFLADPDTKTLSIANLREVSFDHGPFKVRRGVEDFRLFWRDGSWHFLAVMLEKGHTPRSRLCVYRLDGTHATILEKLDGPFPDRPEKNWMTPDLPTKTFDYLYGTSASIRRGHLTFFADREEHSDLLGWRGGSGLLTYKDGYLGVMHRMERKRWNSYNPRTFGWDHAELRDYFHVFMRFNLSGQPTHVSEEFKFDAPGIEYCAGLVRDGDNLIMSYGKSDASSALASLPVSTAENMLRAVEPRRH